MLFDVSTCRVKNIFRWDRESVISFLFEKGYWTRKVSGLLIQLPYTKYAFLNSAVPVPLHRRLLMYEGTVTGLRPTDDLQFPTLPRLLLSQSTHRAASGTLWTQSTKFPCSTPPRTSCDLGNFRTYRLDATSYKVVAYHKYITLNFTKAPWKVHSHKNPNEWYWTKWKPCVSNWRPCIIKGMPVLIIAHACISKVSASSVVLRSQVASKTSESVSNSMYLWCNDYATQMLQVPGKIT
jgi:hypothetical protein